MANMATFDALRLRKRRIEALCRDFNNAVDAELRRLTATSGDDVGPPVQTTAMAAANTKIVGETTVITSLLGSL